MTSPKNKVFVIGDSRTGTLSISRFLDAIGWPSIHYYEKEAEQLPHNEANRAVNYANIKKFIDKNEFVGFSDYPTRLYYQELARDYPDAYFILSVRQDLETWRKSMSGYFSKFHISIDIENLSNIHTQWNSDINKFFLEHQKIKFIEICIDDGSEKNTAKIKKFLGIETDLVMGMDNQTANVRNDLISCRYTLINVNKDDIVNQIQGFLNGFKGLLSEYGWVYLINDTNEFFSYLYGKKQWREDNLIRVTGLFKQRIDYFRKTKVKYFKFIVPEKAVVYTEFLPKTLQGIGQSEDRPAIQLANELPETVFYLADYLVDAKSYGFLYFRGDTHPNWLGAYFIYQYTIKKIRPFIGVSLPGPIPIRELNISIYGYDGDVFSQISPEDSARLNDQWQDVQFSGAFEYCIKYELAEKKRRAKKVALSRVLSEMEFSRELIVKEIDDPSLPTAVIFRDSTSDWMIDLLAEHFRRVVFVWHRGEVIQEILEDEKPDVVLHFMAERFVTAYAETMTPISKFSPEKS